jgi:hypothetical protein
MHSIMRTQRPVPPGRLRYAAAAQDHHGAAAAAAAEMASKLMASTLMTLKRLAGYRNDRDGWSSESSVVAAAAVFM